jgi:hypothetical protein
LVFLASRSVVVRTGWVEGTDICAFHGNEKRSAYVSNN